jgi:DNA-binding Lrp family transcriptional regulator
LISTPNLKQTEVIPTISEGELDKTDERLIAALRRDARASLSDLAQGLGLSRTTVRARIERLQRAGQIVGFTVLTKAGVARAAVRGLMMIGIEGRGATRIIRQLQGLPEVRAIHTTNGRWDLIVEIESDTLEALDGVLARIRQFDGISTSETNLLLSTKAAS